MRTVLKILWQLRTDLSKRHVDLLLVGPQEFKVSIYTGAISVRSKTFLHRFSAVSLGRPSTPGLEATLAAKL